MVIYPVDNAIHRLNNQQGLLKKFRLNGQTEMELHCTVNQFVINKYCFFITCCITSVCPGPVKHATFTEFFAKTFRNLQHPNLLQDRFALWVVKWASSFCSNVVKQVALFYVRFSIALGY